MKIKHSRAVQISGIIWLLIGMFLTLSGLVHFLMSYAQMELDPSKLWILPLFPAKEMGFFVLFLVAMILGFLKARFFLMRSVKKFILGLLKKENPLPLKQIYPLSFYIIVCVMMTLGLILRLAHISQDLRAFLMLTIGIGLLNGSAIYFQFGKAVKTFSESGEQK